jgi:hypothetical protein
MRLIIEGAKIIMVPIVASLLFSMVSFLATGISIVDDVTQVMVNPILPSAMLLRWRQTAG